MYSLQHIVATDDHDDEVQLVNLAVQQRRKRRRRQDSPSYAEPALERRTDVRPCEVGDATIPQPSVPAVESTLFPQYRLFTRNIELVLGCTRGHILPLIVAK